MAFGGDKEKRIKCPAGHFVREDRMPYHLVKHGCNTKEVAAHNPERKVMYNADKKARKMERMEQARLFKVALGIPQQGNYLEPVGDGSGEGQESGPYATTQLPLAATGPPPGPSTFPQPPGQTSQGDRNDYGSGGGRDEDEEEEEWGQPLFPANNKPQPR